MITKIRPKRRESICEWVDEHQEVGGGKKKDVRLKDLWSSRALLAISKGCELSMGEWQVRQESETTY